MDTINTIHNEDNKNNDVLSFCTDKNCKLLEYANYLSSNIYRTYSIFLVSLRPFRFIIARRYDNKYFQNLYFHYKSMTHQFICDTFVEWYDVIYDSIYQMYHMIYFHNNDIDEFNLVANGYLDKYNGNMHINYKQSSNCHSYIYNLYTGCILYRPDPNNFYNLILYNYELLHLIHKLVTKYNYTTIKVDINQQWQFIYTT